MFIRDASSLKRGLALSEEVNYVTSDAGAGFLTGGAKRGTAAPQTWEKPGPAGVDEGSKSWVSSAGLLLTTGRNNLLTKENILG